jgi:uroporphyrinogen-III synthase
MRILVTRPEPDAKRQAERLMQLGHETLLTPLLRIEFLPRVPLELDGVDALIVTSRNALRALEAHPQRGEAMQRPLYVVGDATAKLARELGFRDITTGPGTGEALATLINARGQKGASFLHLSGETVAFDLKAALEAEDFDVRQPILYRAVPATALPPEAVAAIEDGTLDGVILMSPRTAATFADLVRRHGLEGPASRLICYCLSQAVAQAVRPLGARLRMAAMPREEDVLALVAAEAAS